MRYMMVGLMLFLLVTSSWAGNFMDDFEDGNMDEWTYVSLGAGGNWKIENGELILEGLGGASFLTFVIEGPTWKDYTVQVNLKITKHSVAQAGVILRGIVNEYSYGVLFVGANVKQLRTYHANIKTGWVPQHVQEVPFDWEVNTWYVLKAVIEGDNFKYYVNDDLIMEYIDATYPAGGVGLTVTQSIIAHFDNFSVTGEDIPGNLTVLPKARLATIWGQIKIHQ